MTNVRASYRDGVAWIAHNDEPEDLEVESVAGYISTALLAHLFVKDATYVARSVVRERKRVAKEMAVVS